MVQTACTGQASVRREGNEIHAVVDSGGVTSEPGCGKRSSGCGSAWCAEHLRGSCQQLAAGLLLLIKFGSLGVHLST